jgi:pimeloyl-ACP methyl ester carboxylesterase
MYINDTIILDQYQLSYKFYKGGKRYLFLFHGFGQTSDVFDSFVPSVLSEYTVISIDLFFHGKSFIHSTSKNFISINTWNAIFDEFLKKYSIRNFSMLSFSIGARFIVSLFQQKRNMMDRIVLIAPDGFGNTFWFSVATATPVSRFIFRYSLANPASIRFFINLFCYFRFIDSVTKKFLEKNISTDEQRKKIYNTWVYLRKLKLPPIDFIKQINSSRALIMCLVGKEDQLVAGQKINDICVQTDGLYIELDYTHGKMLQAIDRPEVKTFLISNG